MKLLAHQNEKFEKTDSPHFPSPRRINPDSQRMLWVAVGLVGFVGCISFMVSFAGLVAVAEWAGLPPTMRWTVPIFIDTAILVYSIAVLIHRSRGDKTWASWISLAAFTFVSVLANVGHVLLIADPEIDIFRTWIGAVVAGMAPIGVFAATEELGRLAILRPSQLSGSHVDKHKSASHAVEPIVAHPKEALSGAGDTAPTSHLFSNEKPISEDTPSASQSEETKELRPHTEYVTQIQNENSDVDAKQAATDRSDPNIDEKLTPVRYMAPSDIETQKIDELLRTHGNNLTPKHIADALGKTVRTGQRKLSKLQEEHPEIFGTTTQARNQA